MYALIWLYLVNLFVAFDRGMDVLRNNIWCFINTLKYLLLHEGLLMLMCYPKSSSGPYSNPPMKEKALNANIRMKRCTHSYALKYIESIACFNCDEGYW